MRPGLALAALLTTALAIPAPASAQRNPSDADQGAAAPAAMPVLTLNEVLRASARSAPQIIAALNRTRQAEARALSAEGAFDLVFSVDGRSRVEGYYDGTSITGEAKQPLLDNGGYVYGSYRNSRGEFPIYEDKSYTNRAGELKVGALYSLLRDRLIDSRRSKTRLADNDIDIARFEAEATAIGVQSRAVSAYQKWVAAGLKLRAYEALLDLAQTRSRAITRQVELGARPEILLTENEQNLVKRRALVVQAEREFQGAANQLSLYYRDLDGNPVVVPEERLPGQDHAFDSMTVSTDFVLEERPDVQIMMEEIDKASTQLALAENNLRPRLDLKGEVAKDIGSEGLGGYSRTPTEVIVGVHFSVPLQNRAAKGKLAETNAKIDELSIKQRYLREQIQAEVAGISIAVDTALQLIDTSSLERDLARKLASAERRRFELGSSDFFLVNQREETATDAEVKLIEARARIAAAYAELAAATADREALGLAGMGPSPIP